jgi:hypothetical protein
MSNWTAAPSILNSSRSESTTLFNFIALIYFSSLPKFCVSNSVYSTVFYCEISTKYYSKLRTLFSGLLHWEDADVSEKYTAYIFIVCVFTFRNRFKYRSKLCTWFNPEDVGIMFLLNVGNRQQIYTVSQLRIIITALNTSNDTTVFG